MIFLLQIPAWGKGTFGLLLMAILLVLGYPLFAGVLSDVLEGSAYEKYTYGIQNFTDGGANVVRVAVLAVPVLLAFVFRKNLQKDRPMFGICLNGAILNLIFMLLASIRSWIFARFCFYFNHFSIVLLVWSISSTKRNKLLLYVCCVAAYLVYFYFELMSTIYLYS
jgi:transmembrane protein EpsG